MKLQNYISASVLLLIALLPKLVQAQQEIEAQKDSLKQAFLRGNAERLHQQEISAAKKQMVFSSSVTLESKDDESRSRMLNGQIVLRVGSFGHHYLFVTVEGVLARPLSAIEGSKMILQSANGTAVTIVLVNRAPIRGNGKRNQSKIRLEYAIPDEVYRVMNTQLITGIQLWYEEGIWDIRLNKTESSQLRQILQTTN